jgi:hypothetical protein
MERSWISNPKLYDRVMPQLSFWLMKGMMPG